MAVFRPLLFLTRRIIICLALYAFREYSVFAIHILVLNQLGNIIYNMSVLPFAKEEDRKNENLDDITIILVIYHLYCFTDQVPDVYTRSFLGWSLIFFMITNIIYRVTQAIIVIIKEIILKIKACIRYSKQNNKLKSKLAGMIKKAKEEPVAEEVVEEPPKLATIVEEMSEESEQEPEVPQPKPTLS